MIPRTYRFAALLALLISQAGCATWQSADVGPRELIETERPAAVRVTARAGERIVVQRPTVVNDSIAVVSGECRPLPGPSTHMRCPVSPVVALDEVRTVQVRSQDRGRTLSLISPVLVIATFLAIGSPGYGSW